MTDSKLLQINSENHATQGLGKPSIRSQWGRWQLSPGMGAIENMASPCWVSPISAPRGLWWNSRVSSIWGLYGPAGPKFKNLSFVSRPVHPVPGAAGWICSPWLSQACPFQLRGRRAEINLHFLLIFYNHSIDNDNPFNWYFTNYHG